jgi:hypothetical protein
MATRMQMIRAHFDSARVLQGQSLSPPGERWTKRPASRRVSERPDE